jgi:hypothetical protein
VTSEQRNGFFVTSALPLCNYKQSRSSRTCSLRKSLRVMHLLLAHITCDTQLMQASWQLQGLEFCSDFKVFIAELRHDTRV